MSELDKLESYLKDNGFEYKRKDDYLDAYGVHQIVVFKNGERQWDAICNKGSFGYEQGLLEIYGNIVTEEDGDSVAGWLTADDVIKRIEKEGGTGNE